MTATNAAAADLVARALYPWERVAVPRGDGTVPAGCVADWVRTAGEGSVLAWRRRLRWDGWAPGCLRGTKPLALAPWHADLHALVDEARSGGSLPDVALRLGQRQLAAALQVQGIDPARWLAPAAAQSLEQALADRVRSLAAPVLLPRADPLDLLLGTPSADALSAPLALWQRFPVLARFVAVAISQWVARGTEFVLRLRDDQDALTETFALPPRWRVEELRPFLTEAHAGGSSVAEVRFTGGTQLAYKPRPVDMEQAWGELVAWHNRQLPQLALRAPGVLARPAHGWVEWIARRDCDDATQVQAYHRRAGALAAIAHLLGAVDLHCENLVAAGDQPVLLDAECLLPAQRDDDGAPTDGLELLRSGLLPAWSYQGRAQPRNMGGLGPDPHPGAWPRDHLPHLGGKAVDVREHVAALRDGFAQAWRVWLAAAQSADSPLQALRGRRIRYIHRATQAYALVLGSAARAANFDDGRALGIRLDALARGRMAGRQPPVDWPLVRAERAALAQLDLPAFDVRSDGTQVLAREGEATGYRLARAPYEALSERVRGLTQADGARQEALMAQVFAAAPAGPSRPSLESGGMSGPSPWRDAAFQLARELLAEAITARDGAPVWVGPEPEAGLEQVRPHAEHGLYGGTAGIALFLAAAARAGLADARAPALAALRALGQRAIGPGPGWGRGHGGTLAALVHGAQLLDAPHLLQDALLLASQTPHAPVAARDDLMGGRPGAVLGLLLLHGATGDARPRALAVQLAEAMAARSDALAPADLMGTGLTGVSHGASGVALAWLALYHATGEVRWRERALAAFAAERLHWDPARGNWADLRRPQHRSYGVSWCHGAPGIALARLAALAAFAPGEAPAGLAQEAAAALATTATLGLPDDDNLCCGAAGCAETLLVGAQLLQREDLRMQANDMLAAMLQRAHADGTWRLRPRVPCGPAAPGLFTGRAGIGYQLLRAADPALPSVLLPVRLAA